MNQFTGIGSGAFGSGGRWASGFQGSAQFGNGGHFGALRNATMASQPAQSATEQNSSQSSFASLPAVIHSGQLGAPSFWSSTPQARWQLPQNPFRGSPQPHSASDCHRIPQNHFQTRSASSGGYSGFGVPPTQPPHPFQFHGQNPSSFVPGIQTQAQFRAPAQPLPSFNVQSPDQARHGQKADHNLFSIGSSNPRPERKRSTRAAAFGQRQSVLPSSANNASVHSALPPTGGQHFSSISAGNRSSFAPQATTISLNPFGQTSGASLTPFPHKPSGDPFRFQSKPIHKADPQTLHFQHKGQERRNVLIEHLPAELFREDLLRNHFKSTANVSALDIILRDHPHHPRIRTATLSFVSREDAERARTAGGLFNGKNLMIRLCNARDRSAAVPKIIIKSVPAGLSLEGTLRAHFHSTAQVDVLQISFREHVHSHRKTAVITFSSRADSQRAMEHGRIYKKCEMPFAWFGVPTESYSGISRVKKLPSVSCSNGNAMHSSKEEDGDVIMDTASDAEEKSKLRERKKNIEMQLKLLEEKKARQEREKAAVASRKSCPINPKKELNVPVVKQDIRNAKTFVGSCPTMCPVNEMKSRVLEKDLSVFERLAGEKYAVDPARAVKKYRRSAALSEQPSPSEVRPSGVLSSTMVFLLQICDRTDQPFHIVHNFVRDRTRSIRQDFTFQGVTDDACIRIHEQSVRFHIMSEHRLYDTDRELFSSNQNLEQLDKCLISLRAMYTERRTAGKPTSPNEAEMQAYYLLFHMFVPETCSHVLSELPRPVFKHEVLQFAVRVIQLASAGNFARFFSAVREAPYLVACLMHRSFGRVRTAGLKVMASAYSSSPTKAGSIPLENFKKMFGFDSIHDAVAFSVHHNMSISNDLDVQTVKICPDFPPAEAKVQKSEGLIEVKSKYLRPSDIIRGSQSRSLRFDHEQYLQAKQEPSTIPDPVEKIVLRSVLKHPSNKNEFQPSKNVTFARSTYENASPSTASNPGFVAPELSKELSNVPVLPSSTISDSPVTPTVVPQTSTPLAERKCGGRRMSGKRKKSVNEHGIAVPFARTANMKRKKLHEEPQQGQTSVQAIESLMNSATQEPIKAPVQLESRSSWNPLSIQRGRQAVSSSEKKYPTDNECGRKETKGNGEKQSMRGKDLQETRMAQAREEKVQDEAAENDIGNVQTAFRELIESSDTNLAIVEGQMMRLPNLRKNSTIFMKEIKILHGITQKTKMRLDELICTLNNVSPVFADTEEKQENLGQDLGKYREYSLDLNRRLDVMESYAKDAQLQAEVLEKLKREHEENAVRVEPYKTRPIKQRPAAAPKSLTPKQCVLRKNFLEALFASMNRAMVVRFKINVLELGRERRYTGIAHQLCKKLLGQVAGKEVNPMFPVSYVRNESAHRYAPTVVMQSSDDESLYLKASDILIVGVDASCAEGKTGSGSEALTRALQRARKWPHGKNFLLPFVFVVVFESGTSRGSRTAKKNGSPEKLFDLCTKVRDGLSFGFEVVLLRMAPKQSNVCVVNAFSVLFFTALQSVSQNIVKKMEALRMGSSVSSVSEIARRTAKVRWLSIVHKYEGSTRTPYRETVEEVNRGWVELARRITQERESWPPEHKAAQDAFRTADAKIRDRLRLPLPEHYGNVSPGEYLKKLVEIAAPARAHAEMLEVKQYKEFLLQLEHLMPHIIEHLLEEVGPLELHMVMDTVYPYDGHLRLTALSTPLRGTWPPKNEEIMNSGFRLQKRAASDPIETRTHSHKSMRKATGYDSGTLPVNRQLRFTPGDPAHAPPVLEGRESRSSGLNAVTETPVSALDMLRAQAETEEMLQDIDESLLTPELLDELIKIEKKHAAVIRFTIRYLEAQNAITEAANSSSR